MKTLRIDDDIYDVLAAEAHAVGLPVQHLANAMLRAQVSARRPPTAPEYISPGRRRREEFGAAAQRRGRYLMVWRETTGHTFAAPVSIFGVAGEHVRIRVDGDRERAVALDNIVDALSYTDPGEEQLAKSTYDAWRNTGVLSYPFSHKWELRD